MMIIFQLSLCGSKTILGIKYKNQIIYAATSFSLDFLILFAWRFFLLALSAAWRSGSERRFYDDHNLKVHGSITNLVSLLGPWIRCFTMIISVWWNSASSKLKKSDENLSKKLVNKGNS